MGHRRGKLSRRRALEFARCRVVYAALDPATEILGVAVHKTFETLDTVPHVMTSGQIAEASYVHIVNEADVPNRNWLRPRALSAGQQAFGDALLKAHPFVLIPSVVSPHSWNGIFDRAVAKSLYGSVTQQPFALDTRLHPPARATV